MKNIIVGIAVWLLFCNGHCSSVAKETPDCHPYLTIQNKTNDTILAILKFRSYDSCSFAVPYTILPNTIYTPTTIGNDCWETNIINGITNEIYVMPLHGSGLLYAGFFKPCNLPDSNYIILKHFLLNVDSLRKTNFIITYP